MRAEGVKGLKQHGFAGANTGFSKKGGLRPAIRNAGGRVRFRSDTTSVGGGGGLFSRRGGGT